MNATGGSIVASNDISEPMATPTTIPIAIEMRYP
jgi:hypothetical protein